MPPPKSILLVIILSRNHDYSQHLCLASAGDNATSGTTGLLPGIDAYESDEDKTDSDSSDSSTSSDVDVGTLRPLIKRLNEKLKKSC